jgi:urease accessory protein
VISADELAIALQLGDSGFPSGAFSASWGLEGLAADGIVTNTAGVAAFVASQLAHRWATSDRWFASHAYSAHTDIARLGELDHLADAMTIAPAARIASTRSGIALLNVHASLGVEHAVMLRYHVASGDLLGHLPVMHGALSPALGLSGPVNELMSGLQFAQVLTSAAVRLGVIGHLDAQRILAAARRSIVEVCATELPDQPRSAVPQADISMLRHAERDHRLFAC